MSIDTSPITQLAQTAVDDLQGASDDGTEGFVRIAAIVYELDMGDRTTPAMHFSDDRPWVQAAMLREFADHIDALRFQPPAES